MSKKKKNQTKAKRGIEKTCDGNLQNQIHYQIILTQNSII